jgi:acetylornithine deacetylase/succinyl-diaminopimelate desuccinylase family protein
MATAVRERIMKAFDDEYVVDLLQRLIRIPGESPKPAGGRSPDRSDLAAFLKAEMESVGLDVELLTLIEGKPNVFGTMQPGSDDPHLILYTHSDTVVVSDEELSQWKCEPFGAEIRDGRIWGRGAADAKSGVAGIIAAARALRDSGVKLKKKLTLLVATASEGSARGGLTDLTPGGYLKANSVVIADASSRKIIHYYKGRVWHEYLVEGRAIHAAAPHLGINAIVKASKVVQALNDLVLDPREDKYVGKCTFTVAQIQGGTTYAIVPGRCRITTDLRLIPGQTIDGCTKQIQDRLAELQAEDPDLKVTVNIVPYSRKEPLSIPGDDQTVRALERAMTDVVGAPDYMGGIQSPGAATYFTQTLGIPAIYFSPGEISQAHIPNESVDIKKLQEAGRIYALTAADLCEAA